MTELTIEERVAAGAEWLDERLPDWVNRIDLEDLDIRDACACILGQTFGDFDEAPLVQAGGWRAAHLAAWPLGFQSHEVAEAFEAHRHQDPELVTAEYRALEAEWTRLILARREATR